MKLVEVWNVVATSEERPISPWAALSSLKKPPQMAYECLTYSEMLADEYKVIEKQRAKLVCDAVGVPEGSPASIEPETPEFAKFIEDFSKFLQIESKLKPLDISMKELIAALAAETGNAISDRDIALVRPFFQEKPAAELKLVGK